MVLFITTQKNVIYIFVPRRPEFCTYIFTVRKYYRSAYKCFHYFGAAARSFKSTNFWYSAEFIRGTSIVCRGLFFSPPVRRSKIRKPARSSAVCLNKSKRVSKVFRFLSGTSHMHRTISGVARISTISSQEKLMAVDRAVASAEDNLP